MEKENVLEIEITKINDEYSLAKVKKMNSKSVKNEVLDFEDILINYCEEIAEILEDFGGIENAIDYENRRRKENE